MFRKSFLAPIMANGGFKYTVRLHVLSKQLSFCQNILLFREVVLCTFKVVYCNDNNHNCFGNIVFF